MELHEYATFDATALGDLLASGQIGRPELIEVALKAIDAIDPRLNAVIEAWPDAVQEEVQGSAFRGVPCLMDDDGIDIAGRRRESGSRLAAGHISAEDCSLSRRWRDGGLIPIGRTRTAEFGLNFTAEAVAGSPCHNPWHLNRSAGGPPGGAGAAVAAGLVPIAHAVDEAGGLRVVAACNGVFGLTPSRGRVAGERASAEIGQGMRAQFALTRSVRDSAAMLDLLAIRGREADPGAVDRGPAYVADLLRDPPPLRIGVAMVPPNRAIVAASIAAATLAVASLCDDLGHHVTELDLDCGASWDELTNSTAQIWSVKIARRIGEIEHATGRTADTTSLEPATLAVLRHGSAVSADQLAAALALPARMTRTLATTLASHDLILTPTLIEPAPSIGTFTEEESWLDGPAWVDRLLRHAPFTILANLAGFPATSVPMSADPATRMPIGTQFIAAFGREDLLLRLAAQLERASPWSARRPPVRVH